MTAPLFARTALLVALLCPPTATHLQARENPELNRSEPVPADQQIPLVDFFRPARFRQPRLNPAGTHFTAIITNNEENTELLLVNIATKKRQIGSGGTDSGRVMDIFSAFWLDDSHLIFGVTRDKRYAYGVYTSQIDELLKAVPLVRHSVVDIVSLPVSEPTHPILWIRKDVRAEGEDGGALQIDGTHARAMLNPGDTLLASTLREYPSPPKGSTKRYLADKDGNIAFVVTSTKGVPALWRLQADKWIICPVNLEKWNLIEAGDQPDEVIVAPDNEKGQPSSLLRVDAATGAVRGELYSDKDYSLTKARIHRAGKDRHIAAIMYERNKPLTVWFDEENRLLHESLTERFKGFQVNFESADREENRLIVSVRSDQAPEEYFFFDRQTLKLSTLTKSRPWIDASRMAPMRKFTYKTRDGLNIDSYVTLPLGTTKDHPVPLIVLPHGGPFIRDSWGWNALVQFLASRGYAVLQPNYRGSLGYDWSMSAEDPLLFRKMHDDVTDGAKALIAAGVADPRRLAIMGASFGGYLAICGVVNEPELYRCAVTIAGVFDWERVIRESKRNDSTDERYYFMLRNLGDPKKQQEVFDAISPLRHVENIRVPVFVAHGEDDQTAYLSESTALIAQLKKHKVPYEKQIEANEGHSFQKLETRLELFSAIETFLSKNMLAEPVQTH